MHAKDTRFMNVAIFGNRRCSTFDVHFNNSFAMSLAFAGKLLASRSHSQPLSVAQIRFFPSLDSLSGAHVHADRKGFPVAASSAALLPMHLLTYAGSVQTKRRPKQEG